MNILISNDDGILARGLAVLGEVCAALGQVTVVAPTGSRAARRTRSRCTVRCTPRDGRTAPFRWTAPPPTVCSSPLDADAAEAGLRHLGHQPWSEHGEDVFYSGTVAAAMEGLVAGIPSIAVSYAGGDLDVLETHKDGLRSLLKRIVEVKDFPKETLLNINLPALPVTRSKV